MRSRRKTNRSRFVSLCGFRVGSESKLYVRIIKYRPNRDVTCQQHISTGLVTDLLQPPRHNYVHDLSTQYRAPSESADVLSLRTVRWHPDISSNAITTPAIMGMSESFIDLSLPRAHGHMDMDNGFFLLQGHLEFHVTVLHAWRRATHACTLPINYLHQSRPPRMISSHSSP